MAGADILLPIKLINKSIKQINPENLKKKYPTKTPQKCSSLLPVERLCMGHLHRLLSPLSGELCTFPPSSGPWEALGTLKEHAGVRPCHLHRRIRTIRRLLGASVPPVLRTGVARTWVDPDPQIRYAPMQGWVENGGKHWLWLLWLYC